MDSLEILKAKINVHSTLLKLKSSLEDLQKNNPHRHDLIESMLQSLEDVNQFEKTFRELEDLFYLECKANLRHQIIISDLKSTIKDLELKLKIKKSDL